MGTGGTALRAERLVVEERRIDGVDQHTGSAFRSQVQVDPVGEAVLARGLEVPHQCLDQTRDLALLLERLELALARRGLVDEQQVDVRREVQLRAAELAEREQRGRLGDAGLLLRAGESGDQAGVGQAAELAEPFLERALAQIARRDAQQALVLGDADRGPVRPGPP